MTYEGKKVKASRLFAGFEHEQQVNRIATYFNQSVFRYRDIEYDQNIILKLQQNFSQTQGVINLSASDFTKRDLAIFSTDIEAYHQLILDIVAQQFFSTQLILKDTDTKKIFVDGGFSKNAIYMNLLALVFPEIQVYAASMAQATAVGTALSIHSFWNQQALPNDMIELKYYQCTLVE
jgi:glycerol kinase